MLPNIFLTALSFAALLSQVVAIPTISALGSKFFTSDGDQFYIKGVAYQLTEDDPLVDTAQCQLDAALMKQLGANTIRVYHVDGDADHSGCMNAFAAAGIYLFVDLDSFHTYITLDHVTSWTQNKSDTYRMVIDNFQQYDNCAGFFVGNEVLNILNDTDAAPYLLAAAADLKAYRDAKGYRKIPIGYSATDTAILRPMLQDYLVCRPNETERLDFYSLNSYEWCGQSTYSTSGYNILQEYATGYPVPIFLSEDGCNTNPPRTFDDQASIFGTDMADTWSGAIIYEWIQEVNEYGLVNYGPFAGSSVIEGASVINGYTRGGTPTPIAPDFSNLAAQWATLKPTGISSSAYVAAAAALTPPPCPASTSGGWDVDPSAPLPTMGAESVTPGLPSGIPAGSITSAAPSSTATGKAHSAAGKATVNPFSSNESSFLGMLIALMTVGAAVAWWL